MDKIFNFPGHPPEKTGVPLQHAPREVVQYWDHICSGQGLITMISGFLCTACGLDEHGKIHEIKPKGMNNE